VPEVLMKRYYWAAKAVAQLNQILLLNIEERILGSEEAPMRPLNERFFDRNGMIEVASDDLYQKRAPRHPGDLPVYQQHPGSRACRRAPCARCTTRATHGRELPARPGQPRHLHGASCAARRASRTPCG
jgi:UTP:GlnB (protein PII) uridylyltransferase